MNRLVRLISELSLEDLKLIQKDLQAGTLDRLVRTRIQQLDQRKTCPTCGRELVVDEQKFAIEFGPRDLRQKAYFDEYDCLDYFLKQQHKPAENP
jgi:hypothetical protein